MFNCTLFTREQWRKVCLPILKLGGLAPSESISPLCHENVDNISCALTVKLFVNSLLAGIPPNLFDKIQKLMNCAAGLVSLQSIQTSSHVVSSVSFALAFCWSRIRYKISTFSHNVITGSAPPYFSDLLQVYIPSKTLRSSAATRTFRVAHRRKKLQRQRTFSDIGHVTWSPCPDSPFF